MRVSTGLVRRGQNSEPHDWFLTDDRGGRTDLSPEAGVYRFVDAEAAVQIDPPPPSTTSFFSRPLAEIQGGRRRLRRRTNLRGDEGAGARAGVTAGAQRREPRRGWRARAARRSVRSYLGEIAVLLSASLGVPYAMRQPRGLTWHETRIIFCNDTQTPGAGCSRRPGSAPQMRRRPPDAVENAEPVGARRRGHRRRWRTGRLDEGLRRRHPES